MWSQEALRARTSVNNDYLIALIELFAEGATMILRGVWRASKIHGLLDYRRKKPPSPWLLGDGGLNWSYRFKYFLRGLRTERLCLLSKAKRSGIIVTPRKVSNFHLSEAWRCALKERNYGT